MVIGYDDKGLPKTKNVLAKTKSECVEKLKTLKDTLAPPAPPRIKADMPFGDWMEHWYETHSRPAARPGTRRIYEGYLRLYIRPGLGHIPLNRLWMLRSWESASPVLPSDWSARPSVFSQAKNRCISFAVSLFSGI